MDLLEDKEHYTDVKRTSFSQDEVMIRYEIVPPRLFEHEVQMCWTIWMSVKLLQELSDRPIVRDRVRYRLDSFEPKMSIFIAFHNTSSIGRGFIGILDIVVAGRVGLPYVDLDALNRVAFRVLNGARDYAWLAIWIVGHCISM